MRLIIRSVLVACLALVLWAPLASAQYRPYNANANARATGETWHVEFGVGLWNPPPDITVASEQWKIIGTDISAQDDLGMQGEWLKEFKLVLRPAKKHKFRFDYIPISYSGDKTVTRTLVFNGQAFPINIPVKSTVDWKLFNLGYEYDFIYRSRWYLGVILEAKYSQVEVTLANQYTTEWAKAQAPIPTIGGVVRVYPVSNISLTGEITGFKLPNNIDNLKGYDGKWMDYNFYATVNFTDNFGVQGGYRSMEVSYRKDNDRGDMLLKGMYLMGVVRF